jgi:hypothetical protein
MLNRVQAFAPLFAFGQIADLVGNFCTIAPGARRDVSSLAQTSEYKGKKKVERKLHMARQRQPIPEPATLAVYGTGTAGDRGPGAATAACRCGTYLI